MRAATWRKGIRTILAGEDEPDTMWFVDALDEAMREVEALLRIIGNEADTEERREEARDSLGKP